MANTTKLRLLVIGVAVALVAAAGWWGWASLRPATGDAAAEVAMGKALYQQHCASCHGADLEGQPDWRRRRPDRRLPAPPHDATGHTWHHPTEQIFQLTKHGLKPPLAPPGYESDMPGFAETLSDVQIRAVIAFIKSRWPEDIRARHRRLDEAQRR